MNYLESNFAVLKEFHPKIYTELKRIYDEKEYSYEGLEWLESRDGNPVLCVQKGDVKERLNSMYRPLQEAEKWSAQYEFQNMSIHIIMFGIGNGIFVREMLKKSAEDMTAFLYEPDESVFLFTLEHEDFSDILKDKRALIFISGINTKDFYPELEGRVHWSTIPTQIVCEHPGYGKLYLEKDIAFRKDIKKADEGAIVNRNTIMNMSRSIPQNIIKNLHFIKDSNYITEFIGDIGEDIPMIIVSAGPSLDKNIEELKKAEGKAFIFATDTAVKFLFLHDIRFDAVITLDANKWSDHLAGMDNTGKEIPMFCVLEAKHEIMENQSGRKIWFRTGLFIEELYRKFGREFPQYSTGGSVATAAFMIGVALGIKRIILVGQDLAFQGNATHAEAIEEHVKFEEENIEWVEGINGEKVRSRYDWIMYRDWFEEAIKIKSNVDVIDATEGGALIRGSRVMKLKDAIAQYCTKEFDFIKLVKEKKPTFSEEEYELMKKELYHLKDDFINIDKKADLGIRATKELMKLMHAVNKKPERENKLVKRLETINDYIGKQVANELLETYVSDETIGAMQKINCISSDADQNLMDTLQTSELVYKELRKAIKELTPLLEENLEKI